MEAHAYQFTMVGRCGACGQVEEQHPILLPRPDPDTECIIDHRSINTTFRVGEHGGEWSRCPDCGVMIEGAMAKGTAVGPAGGLGRGVLTDRMKRRLGFVNHRNAGLY